MLKPFLLNPWYNILKDFPLSRPFHLWTRLFIACFICFPLLLARAKETAPAMAETARRLISLNDSVGQAKIAYEIVDESRQNWHFFPNWSDRTGISLNHLSTEQRECVKKLLTLLLSSDALLEEEDIRLIHGLKKNWDSPDNPRHLYFISIFGTPSNESTWGWRFEGHHLSLNCTLVGGKQFSVTPSFWGSSPTRVTKGTHKGLQVLGKEQSLSLDLVNSFSAKQKEQALLSKSYGPEPTSSVFREDYDSNPGISYQELKKEQQIQLNDLILLFAEKYRPELVKQIDGRKKIIDPSSLKFSYQYSSKGYVSYFRILSNEYLIEFENIGGNHVHAVWRDFDGDFGRDLIMEHHREDH